MPTLNDIRVLAAEAAQTDLALTHDLVGRALNLSSNSAREAAARAAAAGLFRPRKLAGHGNLLVYQPTPRAAGIAPASAPYSLRRSAPPATIARSLLRGALRYQHRPNLSYLPRAEITALYHQYGVPTHGHPSALIGLDGSHFHLHYPLLTTPGTSLSASIESAISRHFTALESGCFTIHFTAFAGVSADAVQLAINQLAPASPVESARTELAAIDAAIAADRTGLATLELASRRAALNTIIAAADHDHDDDLYPWLDRTVIEVAV